MNPRAGKNPQARKNQQDAPNPLVALHRHGQAVWLDFLARQFLAEGGLEKLIGQDGLSGVTSNPSIFEKAIGGGTDYDSSLKKIEAEGDFGIMALYEQLAVRDIQHAADQLRPVFKATKRADGYVSLEVSPYLAMDTAATISEAERLWRTVGRDNVMIKVPATPAGLPAIRALIGKGINVNITLLFSQQVYEEVVEAYLAGLEHFAAAGGDPGKVASVASFFVSRIDVAVDKLIDERGRTNGGGNALSGLRGKVAIANAKLAYRRYQRLFAGPRWEALKAKGARVQRLLWASTGTKDKSYSDVLYVEELIGPDTVNTMPPATMDAFRDHGKPRDSLEENVGEAERIMAALDRAGISIDAVTAKLVEDGVRLFADAFDKLLGAVARKRIAIVGDGIDAQRTPELSGETGKAVAASLETWRRGGNVRRLWARDARLWTGSGEEKWLGWLGIAGKEKQDAGALSRLSEDVRRQGFTHIVLLGMGGSSLGPEVIAETFGRQSGHPALLVLDSTDPAEIRTTESKVDLARTLFIVSSKSGTTLEPNVLKQYFFERVKAAGVADAGAHFIAVTDPGSKLQEIAERDRFRHVAFGDPAIGGRYSVLSPFGMVPAAAMGLDTGKFLAAAQEMVRACGADVPPADNPGVMLGTILGVLGKSGRDKITVAASPGIAGFGAWLEQLLAESTGKQGKGLIPVDDEPLGKPDVYGEDRLFVYLRLVSEPDAAQDRAAAALEAAGQPVVHIGVTDRYHLGQEFFRWEIATAVAGAILGINPFDQPDVEASKVKTRELTSAYENSGALPRETPFFEKNGITLFTDGANRGALGEADTLAGYLAAHLGRLRAGDYCAFLAYIERNALHRDAMRKIRLLVRDRKQVATCVGFGPRFLHSTGQAYKGGPNTGVFLQITCDDADDFAVPGQKYTFGTVIAAEARGDFEVLAERKRRILRVHLGTHVAAGLTALAEAVEQALA